MSKIDGETFDEARDGTRLTGQHAAVYALMQDQRWRTLGQISEVVSGSEAGVSARLRDLRKNKFGNFKVERRHIQRGLWEYRVLPPLPKD